MKSKKTAAPSVIEAPAATPPLASKGRAVLVTTEHRGVFFGFAEDTTGEVIRLTRARNVLYWSADVRGFMGLAATGPAAGCRVGPAVTMEVRKITAVVEVTDAAVRAFEAAPWS